MHFVNHNVVWNEILCILFMRYQNNILKLFSILHKIEIRQTILSRINSITDISRFLIGFRLITDGLGFIFPYIGNSNDVTDQQLLINYATNHLESMKKNFHENISNIKCLNNSIFMWSWKIAACWWYLLLKSIWFGSIFPFQFVVVLPERQNWKLIFQYTPILEYFYTKYTPMKPSCFSPFLVYLSGRDYSEKPSICSPILHWHFGVSKHNTCFLNIYSWDKTGNKRNSDQQ